MMRCYEHFCGVRVLTYCVLSNHFHLLLAVPRRPEALPDGRALLARAKAVFSPQEHGRLRWRLEQWRKIGAVAEVESVAGEGLPADGDGPVSLGGLFWRMRMQRSGQKGAVCLSERVEKLGRAKPQSRKGEDFHEGISAPLRLCARLLRDFSNMLSEMRIPEEGKVFEGPNTCLVAMIIRIAGK